MKTTHSLSEPAELVGYTLPRNNLLYVSNILGGIDLNGNEKAAPMAIEKKKSWGCSEANS
jgi:hypothetical protein